MRNGRWSKETDFGEGSAAAPGFPDQPNWFCDNRDFGKLKDGLSAIGFSKDEVDGIMGGNWLRFYDNSFGPL
jgi:microsomal dipeptidase-like Zn-dependent dipeptidase